MKLSRKQIRRMIFEAIDMQDDVNEFVGDLEVIDIASDTSPTGDEIIIKVPLKSYDLNGELAGLTAKFRAEELGYILSSGHNRLIVSPIEPQTGYFKFRKTG